MESVLTKMFPGLLIALLVVTARAAILPVDPKPSSCAGNITAIPHPTDCQRFTNCTKERTYGRYLNGYEDECLYPELYDPVEGRCRPFKEARCGPGRVAAKDPCDYLRNKCGGAHCEPCSSRRPSCVGRIDGVHAHPLKLWSPFFMVCDTERTIKVDRCPQHVLTGSPTIFSPVTNSCVTLWEVPASRGGLKPSCDGKEANKVYPVDGRSDVFFSCSEANVYFCGSDNAATEVKELCKLSAGKV